MAYEGPHDDIEMIDDGEYVHLFNVKLLKLSGCIYHVHLKRRDHSYGMINTKDDMKYKGTDKMEIIFYLCITLNMLIV